MEVGNVERKARDGERMLKGATVADLLRGLLVAQGFTSIGSEARIGPERCNQTRQDLILTTLRPIITSSSHFAALTMVLGIV